MDLTLKLQSEPRAQRVLAMQYEISFFQFGRTSPDFPWRHLFRSRNHLTQNEERASQPRHAMLGALHSGRRRPSGKRVAGTGPHRAERVTSIGPRERTARTAHRVIGEPNLFPLFFFARKTCLKKSCSNSLVGKREGGKTRGYISS